MIKKRNLDPSLLSYLMTLTGLGPGIGDVHYLVPVGSSTSNFYEWLKTDMRTLPANIHHTAAEAENALTAYRNDVLLVMPGAHVVTAELAWDKPNTHMVGLAGANPFGDYSEPGASIYTTTITVASVLTVTGQYSQFHNMNFCNNGANAACLTAVHLNIYGTIWKDCGFMGNMNSTQNAVAAAASLYIGTDGHYPIFERCQIGSDVWGLRATANSGQLRFTGSQPNGGVFRDCSFRSIADTATVAMVAVNSGTGIGRGWEFRDCIFNNFSATSTEMNHVFYAPAATGWWPVMLKDCVAQGYSRWTDITDYRIFGNMPVADDGGGLAISLDQTVAGGG